jgi:hypothetical protein
MVGCYQLKDSTDTILPHRRYPYFISTFFPLHDVAHVYQFHQNYIGLPEDGASNAPKHAGAR